MARFDQSMQGHWNRRRWGVRSKRAMFATRLLVVGESLVTVSAWRRSRATNEVEAEFSNRQCAMKHQDTVDLHSHCGRPAEFVCVHDISDGCWDKKIQIQLMLTQTVLLLQHHSTCLNVSTIVRVHIIHRLAVSQQNIHFKLSDGTEKNCRVLENIKLRTLESRFTQASPLLAAFSTLSTDLTTPTMQAIICHKCIHVEHYKPLKMRSQIS